MLLIEQKITKIKDDTIPGRIRKVNEVFDEKLKLQSIKTSTKIKMVSGDLHKMKTKVDESLNKINVTLLANFPESYVPQPQSNTQSNQSDTEEDLMQVFVETKLK